MRKQNCTPQENTNCHFRQLKLEPPAPSFHWQINYHELLIHLSKRFLLITIFFPFVWIYTNDAAVRSRIRTLPRTAPHLSQLLACVTRTPTYAETLCRPRWPLIPEAVASPSCPRWGLGLSQPLSPWSDPAGQPSTTHRHRPPWAALTTLPGLSVFGDGSSAVGKHLLLQERRAEVHNAG